MFYKLLVFCCAATLLTACNSDPKVADAEAVEIDADAAAPPGGRVEDLVSTEIAGDAYKMSGIEGFNYLTDCDSFLVSKLVLADPAGTGEYAYLMGSCVTNKSYDVVAVPRAGHTPAASFGDARSVLAKAQANNFKDYIVYSMTLPKIFRSEEAKVKNEFPANVVVERLEPNRFVRMGVDRVDDADGYKTFLWNVLHDQPLAYD